MALLDNLAKRFSQTNSPEMGKAIEDLVQDAVMRRRAHERRWYDNQFFDDGFHFRVISRKTGRVIDHSYQNSGYVERAIPRASRQIRAVSNLLFAAEPYPVVYPERITIADFTDQMGQINNQAYEQARANAKEIAKKQGIWLTTQWEELNLAIKLIDLLLTAAKTSVAWLQIYSDTENQNILCDVYDGFDIICYGDRREVKDLPFLIKTCPMDIVDIMKDSRFKPEMVKKLTPDNRYASSEIKEAYMRVRYGSKVGTEDQKKTGSVIVKEAFLKEVLTESNWEDAVRLSNDTGAMEGKSKGNMIMRHVFEAGGVTLNDEYVDYDEYPLVDFRFEPGPIYQVPYIERFIPQNKSLDVIVTRLEKWINAMVVGVFQKRKNENFQVSNFPGGQLIEYETTPLTQLQNGSVGNTPFNIIELLNKFIDEQGSTTAGGINVPQGIKSGVAIESVKATEYANLKISTLMLKQTIKNIAERMLERADKDFLSPHEVSSLEDGEPDYFDVIGSRGMQLRQKLGENLPQGIIPIKKEAKVRIEIEPGLGLTMEGKKEAMQQIIDYMIKLSLPPPQGLGLVSVEAIKQVVKRFLETFGYGSTQEFMDAMEEGMTQANLDEDQMKKMQIAMLTALRDSGVAGPEADKKLVDSTKVGTLEAMKDVGMLDGVNKTQAQPKSLAESLSISFKDLPEDTKADVLVALGFPRPQTPSPAGSEQAKTHVETMKTAQTPIVDPIKQQELGIKKQALNKNIATKTQKAKS